MSQLRCWLLSWRWVLLCCFSLLHFSLILAGLSLLSSISEVLGKECKFTHPSFALPAPENPVANNKRLFNHQIICHNCHERGHKATHCPHLPTQQGKVSCYIIPWKSYTSLIILEHIQSPLHSSLYYSHLIRIRWQTERYPLCSRLISHYSLIRRVYLK